MTSDRIEVTAAPDTGTDQTLPAKLPLNLNRIRDLAYYDAGNAEDSDVAARTLACIELFEQETGQVLLRSTLRARWPSIELIEGARPVLPLEIPGLDASLVTLTQGGADILSKVSTVKRRWTGALDVYPTAEIGGCWSGAEIVATFTAGMMPGDANPAGRLPSNVIEVTRGRCALEIHAGSRRGQAVLQPDREVEDVMRWRCECQTSGGKLQWDSGRPVPKLARRGSFHGSRSGS